MFWFVSTLVFCLVFSLSPLSFSHLLCFFSSLSRFRLYQFCLLTLDDTHLVVVGGWRYSDLLFTFKSSYGDCVEPTKFSSTQVKCVCSAGYFTAADTSSSSSSSSIVECEECSAGSFSADDSTNCTVRMMPDCLSMSDCAVCLSAFFCCFFFRKLSFFCHPFLLSFFFSYCLLSSAVLLFVTSSHHLIAFDTLSSILLDPLLC